PALPATRPGRSAAEAGRDVYCAPVEPVERVRYRPRSMAISAMWWMNSRLPAQMTLLNGTSAASLQGYWQYPTVSSCSPVTAATLARQRSTAAQNRSRASADEGL